MGKYHRLTQGERYQIEALLVSGKGVRFIARQLGRSPGSISREIQRNILPGRIHYKAKIAQGRSRKRRVSVGPPLKMQGALRELVLEKLLLDWSPEQIAGRLLKNESICISQETIYQFIYNDRKLGGDLWKHLRRRRRWRRSRASHRRFQNLGKRTRRTWIEDRPKEVEKRARLGDFERDTVEGKRGRSLLLTIVDRKSKLTKICWLEKKNARLAHRATVAALKNLKVNTITNDNGPEFELHGATASELGTKIYFSRPYCSWQRGTNENTNGLIRQYFPKKTDPCPRKVKAVEQLLNNRPRKTLGFKTPLEVHRKYSRGVAMSF